jgi:hypothetical protein
MRSTLLTIALLFTFGPDLAAPQNFSPIPVAQQCSVFGPCMVRCEKAGPKTKDCRKTCQVCK